MIRFSSCFLRKKRESDIFKNSEEMYLAGCGIGYWLMWQLFYRVDWNIYHQVKFYSVEGTKMDYLRLRVLHIRVIKRFNQDR